mmetsp:Transcript_72672/g.115058  ORF Transcript_72672/g.115058 Transcript_72672/m.115058 type:complete len:143 (-) Transcript_72672:265-693(-)
MSAVLQRQFGALLGPSTVLHMRARMNRAFVTLCTYDIGAASGSNSISAHWCLGKAQIHRTMVSVPALEQDAVQNALKNLRCSKHRKPEQDIGSRVLRASAAFEQASNDTSLVDEGLTQHLQQLKRAGIEVEQNLWNSSSAMK